MKRRRQGGLIVVALVSLLFAGAGASARAASDNNRGKRRRPVTPPPSAEAGGGEPRKVERPITVMTKRGEAVRANLVGGDADSIRVEVGGVERDIPWDEMTGYRDEPRLFDRYGRIPWDDEKARLDNVAIEMQNDPAAEVYIIVYPAVGAKAGRAGYLSNRAAGYLVEDRGIDRHRVKPIAGKSRKRQQTYIWLVSPGAQLSGGSQSPSHDVARGIARKPDTARRKGTGKPTRAKPAAVGGGPRLKSKRAAAGPSPKRLHPAP